MKLREAKYTKDSMILRKKIIDYAKVLGYKLHSTEKQARSFAMWFNGNNKEKLEKFLLKNGFKRGGEYANFDFSKGDIGFRFQGPGNFYMAHWYSTPTKLDRGIDATVSDKDYFGEIRREIRKVLGEQRSSWKEQQIERDKIWGCIEYFASGNYNELADYQFSSEQLIKQAKDYIKGSKYQKFLKCCEKTLKEQKSESDTVGWYMDGEGGWADIPLLKKHLDSSFVGIHNDGTYFFDTEDPSERSGDMLSFRGFSEVLHRLGLKVDAHKVSDQLYKLSPQRLKIDLIEADMSLWEQKMKEQTKYAIMQAASTGDKVSLDTARFLRKGSREIWWTTKKSDALLFNTKSQAVMYFEDNNIDACEPRPKIVAIKKSLKEQKSKDLIHSYQDWKDSVRGIYGVGIRLVLTADSSKTLVFRANKKVLGKQLSAYYDHIEQVGYVIKEQVSQRRRPGRNDPRRAELLERGAQRDQDRRLERPELRYKHPNKFSKGATFPYADVKMMKSPINRDKLVIRFDGRSYEIMNRDTGEFFAEELSYIELEDTLVQLDVDREMTRSLVVQSESGQEVNIP